MFPFDVIDQKVICDVFHYAKHKKLPYVSSFNKSKHHFDLVQFDVWGPLAIKFCHAHSYFFNCG